MIDDYDQRIEAGKQDAYSFIRILRDLNQTGIELPKVFRTWAGLEGEADAWINIIHRCGEAINGLKERAAEFGGGLKGFRQHLREESLKEYTEKVLGKVKGIDPSIDSEHFREIFKEAARISKDTKGPDRLKEAAVNQYLRAEFGKRAGQKAFEEAFNRYFELNKKKGMSDNEARYYARDEASKIGNAAARRALAEYDTADSARARAYRTAVESSSKGGRILKERMLPSVNEVETALDEAGLLKAAKMWLAKQMMGMIKDSYARFVESRDNATKKWIAQMQQANKIVALGIKQESDLRRTQAKMEDELAKSRISNAQKVAALMVTALTSEITLQERLMAIEEERTRARLQGDLRRQKATQAREQSRVRQDFAVEQSQKKDQFTRRTDTPAKLAAFIFNRWMYRDEFGDNLHKSMIKAIDKAGWTQKGKERGARSLMATASEVRKNNQAAMDADIDAIASSYDSLMDVLSSAQVGEFSESTMQMQSHLENRYQALLKQQGENGAKIQAGKLYRSSFEEAIKNGQLVYDKTTKRYVYQDENGNNVAVKNKAQFERKKEQALFTAGGFEAVQMAAAMENQLKNLEKEAEFLKEKVKYEQAAVALAQEAVKAQAQMLKSLQDQIQKNIDSDIQNTFGMDKRKTGEEFAEEMANRLDEQTMEVQADKYKGSPEAEEEFRQNYKLEMQYRKDLRRIDAKQSKEALDQRMKHQVEEHERRLKNEQELHNVQLQNAYNLFRAEQDYIKAQQDAFLKMVNAHVSIEEVDADLSGKSVGQVAKDLGNILIDDQAQQQKQKISADSKINEAKELAEFDEQAQNLKGDILLENQQKLHKLEDEQLKAKYDLERQLALKEHELRVKLITAEAKYKKEVEEASKADEQANLDFINDFYKNNKKEANSMAQSMFKKDFDDLNDDQKKLLVSQHIQQVQGAALKGLAWLKANKGASESDYRDENGVLDVQKIKKDIVAAAEEHDLLNIKIPHPTPGKEPKTREEILKERTKGDSKLVELSSLTDLITGTASDEFLEQWQKNGSHLQTAYANARNDLENTEEELEKEVAAISEESAQAAADRAKEMATLRAEIDKTTASYDNNVKIVRELHQEENKRAEELKQNLVDIETRRKKMHYNLIMNQESERGSIAKNTLMETYRAQSGAEYSMALVMGELKNKQLNERIAMQERQENERLAAQEALDLAQSSNNPQAIAEAQKRMTLLTMRHSDEQNRQEAKQMLEEVDVQRRIGRETGTTMAADAMWEQIQASAFAHTEDPTVSAIETFNRSMDESFAKTTQALYALSETGVEQSVWEKRTSEKAAEAVSALEEMKNQYGKGPKTITHINNLVGLQEGLH